MRRGCQPAKMNEEESRVQSFDVWKVHDNGTLEIVDSLDHSEPAPGLYVVVGDGKRFEVRIADPAAKYYKLIWQLILAFLGALLALVLFWLDKSVIAQLILQVHRCFCLIRDHFLRAFHQDSQHLIAK